MPISRKVARVAIRTALTTHYRINRTVNEIPQAANRVLRCMPNRVCAADRVVGEGISQFVYIK